MARTYNLTLPRLVCEGITHGNVFAGFKVIVLIPTKNPELVHLTGDGVLLFEGAPMRVKRITGPLERGYFRSAVAALAAAVAAIRADGYDGKLLGTKNFTENIDNTTKAIYVAAKHISRSGIVNPKFTWKIFVPVVVDGQVKCMIPEIRAQFQKPAGKRSLFWYGEGLNYFPGELSYDHTCRVLRGEGLSFDSAREAKSAGEKLLRDSGYIGVIKKIALK